MSAVSDNVRAQSHILNLAISPSKLDIVQASKVALASIIIDIASIIVAIVGIIVVVMIIISIMNIIFVVMIITSIIISASIIVIITTMSAVIGSCGSIVTIVPGRLAPQRRERGGQGEEVVGREGAAEGRRRTILYYTILYYTILYYTILYYTILYYTILYYTILYYIQCPARPAPRHGEADLDGG